MKKIVFLLSVIFITFNSASSVAESDTQSCMWLKEKYKDCLRSRAWRRVEWYDMFGALIGADPPENDRKVSSETLSFCNSWSTTLKEERCD